MGARLTWTSSGERKIDTRTAGPTNSSASSTTSVTVPSAGARTALGSADTSRSGSRKKPSEASEAAANGRARRRRPASHSPPAITAGPRMKGQPSRTTGSLIGALHPRRLDPGHHRPEPLADFLDGVLGVPLAHGQEARPVGLVLQHPFAGELARLDLDQDLLHLRLRFLADDARPPRVVAVLGGVGDGVAHVGQPALVEEVDDQLHLVHALEVSDLGLVAGLHQRLEGALNKMGDAATESRLFSKEARFCFFSERGLDDPGAGTTDPLGVGQRDLFRLARHVLLDGQEGRDAT